MIGFGLYSKLGLAAVISTALAAGAWKSYTAGKQSVQAEWTAQKLVDTTAALNAVAESRIKEQALQATVTKAQNDARKREAVLKADATDARSVSAGLSGDLAAHRLQMSSLTRAAVDKYASVASVVFEGCINRYISVAGRADEIANDRTTLIQAWPIH